MLHDVLSGGQSCYTTCLVVDSHAIRRAYWRKVMLHDMLSGGKPCCTTCLVVGTHTIRHA